MPGGPQSGGLIRDLFIGASLFIGWVMMPSCLMATTDNHTLGARPAAMANATVMLPGLWSVHHNQAGLAQLDRITVGIHHENRFVVPELGLHSIAMAVPTRPGTLGFHVSYFGYSKYHDTKVGLSFGKQLSAEIAAGVQVNYLDKYIAEEYGRKGAITFEIGLIAEPVEGLFLGVHAYNPVRNRFRTETPEPISTLLRLGAGYLAHERLMVTLEAEKELLAPTNVKVGLEYMMVPNLYIRTGIASEPFRQSFGMGYAWKNLVADIAFTHHPQLGITPHFSMMYMFK